MESSHAPIMVLLILKKIVAPTCYKKVQKGKVHGDWLVYDYISDSGGQIMNT